MMRGLTAFTSVAPSPSLSSAPGRYASRNTSDLPASLRRISTASERLRSSTRLRLLRLSATKLTLSPLRIGVARPMSPCGGSTLITSAPMSASSVPASGPAMKFASSITFIPASGFGIRFPTLAPFTHRRMATHDHWIFNPALSMISLYIGTSRAMRARNTSGPRPPPAGRP